MIKRKEERCDSWYWEFPISGFGVFILCFLSTLLCVVYGLINWNKGADKEPTQMEEHKDWEEKQEKIIEEEGL